MISRKSILILFGTFLLVILLSNIFGYVGSNYKPKYGITTANVNFRSSAALNSSTKIKTVAKNTKLKMVGEISDFYIVQLTTNEVGLIHKSYIKQSGSSLPQALVYENLGKSYAYIKGNSTNVRGGPGTNFKSLARLSKGVKVQIIGKIGQWNMIVTENNLVGMIRQDLLSKTAVSTTTPTTPTTPTPTTPTQPSTTTPKPATSEAQTIFNLINNARKANGIALLSYDATLNNVAQIKSNDMVANNYFSHTSPRYGSPFAMMQGFGVTYKTAGENIAGNPSLQGAFDAWMNSEGHRKNILSSAYNYIGIGVTKSSTYGYVISTMFIGR